ncbi:DUF4350 domain-containing protein [Amphritea opalescens]|nr:DUF4350 domain-containing protein [Amphritea opalescens]
MSATNRMVLWGLGALLIAGLAWYAQWFFTHYERQTDERRVDVSPQAQRNPLFAAELFLSELGYEVESFRARDLTARLPSSNDALVVRRMPPDLTDQQRNMLKRWVSDGGVLMLTPPSFDQNDEISNAFLADLGVQMRASQEGEEDAECESEDCPISTDSTGEESTGSGYRTVTMTLAGEPEPIEASFRQGRFLQDRDQWAEAQFGSGEGAQLLEFAIGRGKVYVLSDLDLFTNGRINELDHAFLLSHLVSGSQKVWLQYGIDTPSLPVFLWQKIPFILMSLGALLLLMGWRLFLYTGPRLNLDKVQRRNLLEHIDATADYAWRLDKGYSLFDHNRKTLEQAWRKRHPGLNMMDNTARAEWIGEKTGMAGRAVERSLYQPITKDQDFIKATLVLQQLASGLKQRELR